MGLVLGDFSLGMRTGLPVERLISPFMTTLIRQIAVMLVIAAISSITAATT